MANANVHIGTHGQDYVHVSGCISSHYIVACNKVHAASSYFVRGTEEIMDNLYNMSSFMVLKEITYG